MLTLNMIYRFSKLQKSILLCLKSGSHKPYSLLKKEVIKKLNKKENKSFNVVFSRSIRNLHENDYIYVNDKISNNTPAKKGSRVFNLNKNKQISEVWLSNNGKRAIYGVLDINEHKFKCSECGEEVMKGELTMRTSFNKLFASYVNINYAKTLCSKCVYKTIIRNKKSIQQEKKEILSKEKKLKKLEEEFGAWLRTEKGLNVATWKGV